MLTDNELKAKCKKTKATFEYEGLRATLGFEVDRSGWVEFKIDAVEFTDPRVKKYWEFFCINTDETHRMVMELFRTSPDALNQIQDLNEMRELCRQCKAINLFHERIKERKCKAIRFLHERIKERTKTSTEVGR